MSKKFNKNKFKKQLAAQMQAHQRMAEGAPTDQAKPQINQSSPVATETVSHRKDSKISIIVIILILIAFTALYIADRQSNFLSPLASKIFESLIK